MSYSDNYKRVYNNILEAIGYTPMVKLNKITEGIKANVYAKLEFFNPGGSIKDRIGRAMIEKAEREGLIKPGYTIVEPTSGNTGMGLVLAAIVKGYKVILTIPDKMSTEKINLLRAMGAEVIVTPTSVPPDHPSNYIRVAERLVKENPKAFMPNQYFNPANPEAHYLTTGPEIWEQLDGKVDVLVAGIGTGGTISGTGRYLKEKNPSIKVVGVDPEGSIYYHKFYGTEGEVHTYKVEGIGEDFMPSTYDPSIVDEIIVVNDKEAFLTARELAKKEGIFAGGSSGAAVFGALKVAKELDEGKNVVVILPDSGRNYVNKIYNDYWMIENGFLDSPSDGVLVEDIIRSKVRHVKNLIYLSSKDKIGKAVELMVRYDISQIPVIDDGVNVGVVTDKNLVEKLYGVSKDKEKCRKIWECSVETIIEPPLPVVNIKDVVSNPFLMLKDRGAALVSDGKSIIDIVTSIDIVEYYKNRG